MAITHQKPTRDDPQYLLQRDEAESERLVFQARLFDSFTRRFLIDAGIREGMTVLDIGSGAGDVAFIAADLVGPAGKVVGVDSDPAILEIARGRGRDPGYSQVSFVAGDVRSVTLDMTFDAIFGRMVLLYMADPASLVRDLATHLRPGGVIGFQDVNTTTQSVKSIPQTSVWRNIGEWAQAAVQHAGLTLEMGFSLRQVFIDAGLPAPQMRFDSAIGGGPNWDGYEYIAASMRSMSHLIYQSGVATPEDVDIDTLADRLRRATIAVNGVGKLPDLIGAWTMKP
jgi:SAM-dependent methyltransferase